MHAHAHAHFTCHGNGSSWSSGQKRGSSCTLSPTDRPSACPGYAQPMGSQICSDGQWNDRSHGLNHRNQELDTSCFKDRARQCILRRCKIKSHQHWCQVLMCILNGWPWWIKPPLNDLMTEMSSVLTCCGSCTCWFWGGRWVYREQRRGRWTDL